MPRAKNAGNGQLEQALATLIQNQASFVGQMRQTDARLAEIAHINEERFARIEERFARIEALLLEHNRILQALPDVIRDKIGFKPSSS